MAISQRQGYNGQRGQQNKTVNWFSTSRVDATMTWDWLYNHMTETERRTTMAKETVCPDCGLHRYGRSAW